MSPQNNGYSKKLCILKKALRLCVLCEIIYINSSVISEFVAAVLKLVYWIRKISRKERKDAKSVRI